MRATVAVLLVIPACSADSELLTAADLDSKISAQCEADFSEFLLNIHEAKSCAVAADCVFVPGATPVFEHCSPGYYVNPTHPFVTKGADGESDATTIEHRLEPCFAHNFPVGCFGSPTLPICWESRCYPRPVAASPPACLQAADNTACSKCNCGSCADELSNCLADAGCRELYLCSKQTGALGRYVASIPLDSYAPCAAVVDGVGGPSSGSALTFQNVVSCNMHSGCFALCQSEG